METKYQDHRSRVAKEKRDAMHTRLLEATMVVFANKSKVTPSIELVVQQAGVSRGTFYKHFSTLDEALVATGQYLTDEMTVGMFPIYDAVEDAIDRVSTGMRLYLTRAALDNKWAAFVSRAELMPSHSLLLQHLASDLNRGESAKEFSLVSPVAARDLVTGLTFEAMKGFVLGRIANPAGYIDASITLVLRAFGVDAMRCKAAVDFSRNHLATWSADVPGYWTEHVATLDKPVKRGRAAPVRKEKS